VKKEAWSLQTIKPIYFVRKLKGERQEMPTIDSTDERELKMLLNLNSMC